MVLCYSEEVNFDVINILISSKYISAMDANAFSVSVSFIGNYIAKHLSMADREGTKHGVRG